MSPTIVFLCTGNAARSVMATVMFRSRCAHIAVSGAGTHVIEGHPMSVRTRAALARHGLSDPTHRSRQLWLVDAQQADLIVAMAPEHVAWVRRTFPALAPRTGTLKRLVRELADAPAGVPLGERVAALELHLDELEAWEEIVDPGAGEQDEFDACADELNELLDALVAALC